MLRTRLAVVPSMVLVLAACGGNTGPLRVTGGGAGAGGSAATTGSSLDSACADPVDHTGDGTFYAADGSGNCSFEPTGDRMIAAMNHDDYAGSAACGACVHLVGPSGEVTVRIVDQCPECHLGDLDLSPEAFARVADPSLGRVAIHWKYTPCDVAGPLVYHFKDGSNEWWTAVQIRGSRYAIESVEFKRDGEYVGVDRLDYNYFVADAGMGPGPYALRVTDVKGQVVEDVGIPLVAGGDASGAGQFPVCSP